MTSYNIIHLIFLLIEVVLILSKNPKAQTGVDNEKPSEDPTLWPGHMEFLGSGNNVDVDTVSHNTSSQRFLNEYVKPQKPLRLRRGCAGYPAMREWERDENLIRRPDSFTTMVPVLGQTSNPGDIPFAAFLRDYVKKNWYIYSEVPSNLRAEVYLPNCMMCNPILQQLSSTFLWYSGRDRFLPIQSSVDNVVKCVISGTMELTLIDPVKYSKQMPTNPGEVDVSKVDYRHYPGLREILFDKALLSPGDCLYIPANWYHQISGYGRTISVDVTFHQNSKKDSAGVCGTHRQNQTLWEHTFSQNSIDKRKDLDSALHHFIGYLTDQNELTYDQFVVAIKKDELLLTNMTQWTGEYNSVTEELFRVLDQTSDGEYSYKDIEDLTIEQVETLRGVLLDRLIDYGEIMLDQQEDLVHKNRQSQGGLDPVTQDFIGQYVDQLETVLVESIDQFVKTGTMPNVQEKMAAMDVKKLIGKEPGKSNKPEEVKVEQSEYYISREDAKAQLKTKREKVQAAKEKKEKEENIVTEDENAFVVVGGADEEEEILADDVDEVETAQGDPSVTADSQESTSTTKPHSNEGNSKRSSSKINDKKSAKKDEL